MSIVSLNFYGFELESNSIDYNNILNKEMKKNEYKEEKLDEICVMKLKEIKATLDLCVQKEKYDSAKIFRELYQRVKLLGEKINYLSECKLKCIETNKFDECKNYQKDINRIKNLIQEINANYIDNEDEKNNEKEEQIDDPFK